MTYEEKVKSEAQIILKKYEAISQHESGYYELDLAKECALLEIDGRIEEVKHWQPRVTFLNNVKKEIENL